MRSFIITLLASGLSLLSAVRADSHQETNLRRHGNNTARYDTVEKRFSNARFTWYDTEQDVQACGGYDKNSQFVVALNSDQYCCGYPGPQCGKGITISYGGKTAHATIRDECPSCPYGALDLSEGLFAYFASMDVGVLYGTWEFDGSSGGGSSGGSSNNNDSGSKKSSTKSKAKSSTKHSQATSTEKTSTKSHTSKTGTSTPTPTLTLATTTAVPPLNFDAGPASGLASPTGTVDYTSNPQNINQLNLAVVGMAGIAVAAKDL